MKYFYHLLFTSILNLFINNPLKAENFFNDDILELDFYFIC